MSVAQILTIPAKHSAPAYPFLSQPPPQKKRPNQPLPPIPSDTLPCLPVNKRLRSATITAWVADVQPGSPAPVSPRRSPSIVGRRPSLSRSVPRRPSVTSVRVASASFLSFSDTPTSVSRPVITPSVKEFNSSELAAMGYTSVFVHFPTTPSTPGARQPSPVKSSHKGLKSFRSLTSLKSSRRNASRTNVALPSPPLPKIKTAAEVKRARAESNAAVAKVKKSKYMKYRPAPLATDLALAQFMDGGKMEDHITRFTQAQAKAAGAVKVDGQLVGVGSIWRDGEGGIWRDEDEEWEYTHLLGGDDDVCMGDWVEFVPDGGQGNINGYRESVSTQDSDLSARFAMKTDADVHDDLAVFGGAVQVISRTKPGMSVLAIPSRARRTANHLQKPGFLLDVFPIPSSPPGLPSRSPRSPRFGVNAGRIARNTAKSKARRRPAPLKLTPRSPGLKCPINSADPETIRFDFLADSFEPAPAPRSAVLGPALAFPPVQPRKGTTKAPAMNMKVKGILKAIGGKKQPSL